MKTLKTIVENEKVSKVLFGDSDTLSDMSLIFKELGIETEGDVIAAVKGVELAQMLISHPSRAKDEKERKTLMQMHKSNLVLFNKLLSLEQAKTELEARKAEREGNKFIFETEALRAGDVEEADEVDEFEAPEM